MFFHKVFTTGKIEDNRMLKGIDEYQQTPKLNYLNLEKDLTAL